MFPSIHPTPGWGHVSVGSWVVTLSLAFLNKIFFSCSSTPSRLTNLFFWRRGLARYFDIPRLISLCNDHPQIATEAITMHFHPKSFHVVISIDLWILDKHNPKIKRISIKGTCKYVSLLWSFNFTLFVMLFV